MQSLSEIPEAERREIARRHVESLEAWLRRLIDHQLRVIGPNYHQMVVEGNPVIPPKIAKKVADRLTNEPHRYPRWIDATQLNEAISILLHHYERRFQTCFNPLPKLIVMHMLDEVGRHRNPLMHGNTCSVRALEQSVCYSNDLIEACKAFFMTINKDRQYDAPTFTRFTDSNGNIFHVTAPEGQQSHFDARKGSAGMLHVGDVVTFEVEVDESYPPDTYKVQWAAFWGGQTAMGSTFMACTRFRRHRVRCFDGAGGGSWRDGSLRGSSSLKRCA